MNSFSWAVFAMLAMTLLGCDNPKDVSKTNFQRVINDQLRTEKLCVEPLRYALVSGNSENGYPVAVTTPTPELDLFLHTGLLSATPSMAVPAISFERKPVPATTYSLTDKGKQSYSGPPRYGFCYGTPEATKILEYTEPADRFGAHITQVTFVVGIRDYSDWASDVAIRKRFGTIGPDAKGVAVLRLTSEGWKVAERGISYKHDTSK